MEKLILKTLTSFKPVPTRKLMKACKVKMSRQVGVLSDAEYDFVSLLDAMREKGSIVLVEHEGWLRR